MNAVDLNLASNLWGPLDGDVRSRLNALIENPSIETWDDAHSIILSRNKHVTLWQAILAVDPTFSRAGRRVEMPSGRVVDDWPQVPSRETIIQAINYATH